MEKQFVIVKIDSDICYVMLFGGNVFVDLGFYKQDVEKFYVDFLSEIENMLVIK